MESGRSVEQIIREIVPRLTGDEDQDEDVFYEMGNLYSDHPGFDIACARLAGEYAGIVATRIALKQRRGSGKGEKRSRPKFPRADGYVSPPSPESDCREMKYELKHIGLFYARNNFDEALWIADDLIYRIEKLEMPIRESANIESRYYNEPFEEILDARLSLMDDEIQITDRPIPRVFFLCGSILNHLKQFDEAKAVFKRGLDYNPVDFNLMSEYIAAVRRTSDLEKFKEQIERAFRIAFRARDIARCYRYEVRKKSGRRGGTFRHCFRSGGGNHAAGRPRGRPAGREVRHSRRPEQDRHRPGGRLRPVPSPEEPACRGEIFQEYS